jgi:hypothetical protein
MHHVATITKTANKALPFHAQCSCGPAGDFSAKESAEAFLRSHLAKQGGISTQELADKADESEAVEQPVPPIDSLTAEAQVPAEPEAGWPKKKKK